MTDLRPGARAGTSTRSLDCTVQLHEARHRDAGEPASLAPEIAYQVVLAGLEAALVAEQAQTIVVLDDRGQTLAVGSVPTASPRARIIATDKAFTACTLGLDTERLSRARLELGDDAEPLAGIVAGGVPIWHGAVVLGAIGVSGGDATHDHATATAARAAAKPLTVASRASSVDMTATSRPAGSCIGSPAPAHFIRVSSNATRACFGSAAGRPDRATGSPDHCDPPPNFA